MKAGLISDNPAGKKPVNARNLRISRAAGTRRRPANLSERRAAEALKDVVEGVDNLPVGSLRPSADLTSRQQEIFHHLVCSYPKGTFLEADRQVLNHYCRICELAEIQAKKLEDLGMFSDALRLDDDGNVDVEAYRAATFVQKSYTHLVNMLAHLATKVRAVPNSRLAFTDGLAGMRGQQEAEQRASEQKDVLDSIHADLSGLLGDT